MTIRFGIVALAALLSAVPGRTQRYELRPSIPTRERDRIRHLAQDASGGSVIAHPCRVLAIMACASALSAGAARAQFTPFPHDPKYLLEGNWQSCRDSSGQYDERVYDQPALGLEIHLGPNEEFAIFKGIQEEHRDHRSEANLLLPNYRVRGRQHWELGEVIFEVARAGGSRFQCRSFFITLEPRNSK